jgi:hypothetical protein
MFVHDSHTVIKLNLRDVMVVAVLNENTYNILMGKLRTTSF